MKAAVHHEYGPPEVLVLEDLPDPVPADDEVLIRVRAAGVNWADWSAVTGTPYVMRLGYGLRRPRRGRCGSDVAGVVEAAGSKVRTLRPGDEVFGQCTGAFAEYVCADEDDVLVKPADLTFEQAAAVPMAGIVALQAMRDVGKVTPGRRVLVNGASGGIGTFAVQIAKALGAEVTGVCSTANVELVRSLGADHVIDYTGEDFTRGGRRYDVILDIADVHGLGERRAVLTPDGTLIPNSGEGNAWVGSIGRILWAWTLSPFVRQTLRPFLSVFKRDDLSELRQLIRAGKVTPIVGRTFPLSAAAEAVGYAGARHATGKTVITV